MSARPLVALVGVALALASSQVLHAAPLPWAHDPARNLPIATNPTGDCVYGLVSDGKDGALLTVANPCSLVTSLPAHFPDASLRLFHLKRGEAPDPAWAAGGVALPVSTNQAAPCISDGAGGELIAWSDTRNLALTNRDEYVLHVRADGTLDPAWPASGVVACAATGAQLSPRTCTDGQGGVFLAWSDRRDSVTNLSDIYATHVRANGTLDPGMPANGRAVYAGVAQQSAQTVLPDGAHGAYVVWSDRRNVATNHGDIYAQHLLADGTLDPAWPVGGLGVAATTQDENFDGALADGAGGGYVSFEDFGTGEVGVVHFLPGGTLDAAWPVGGVILSAPAEFAQATALMKDGAGGIVALWDVAQDDFGLLNVIEARHVLANGTFDPAWGPDPRPFAPTPDYRSLPFFAQPLPDPAGGGIVSWLDSRPSAPGLYALKVDANLVAAPGWDPHGVPIATAPHAEPDVWNVPAGQTGFLYAFTDERDSVADGPDVYAQRLSARGRLGADEPMLAAVRDVPGDQGGHALVQWYWSSFDTLPAPAVTAYDVWRELDGASLTAAQRASALPASALEAAPAPGALRVGALDTFWEFVGATPARGTSSYALSVPTLADSTAASGGLATYEVDAHVAPANEVLTSPPDSGYSVDNLAPAAPTGFAGAYSAGTATLHWDPVIAPDLAGYALYRGVPSSFTPSPASLVATPTTTNFTDVAGAAYYYKLAATDVHGNASAVVTLLPSGIVTGVADSVVLALSLGRPAPDPASAFTRLAYALPRAGAVRLAVYDLAGRLVRRLADGAVEPAGAHARAWDLRGDDGGRVRAGMYFVRFEALGARFERRVIVTR